MPGTDLATKAAREFFERNGDITAAGQELRGFNAYGWAILADRAYGKVVDRAQIEVSGKLSLEQVLAGRKKAGK